MSVLKYLWIFVVFAVAPAQYQYNQNQNQPNRPGQPQQQNPQQPNVWQQQQQQQRQGGNQQGAFNRPAQNNQQGQQFYLGANQQQQQIQQHNPYGYSNPYGQQHTGATQTGILTTPNRQRYGNFSNAGGANLYFKINGYSNPGMTMPGGKTCVCPTGSCTYLQNVPYPCLIAFTAIMTSSDQNVQYIASDFVPYNGSTATLALGNWNNDNNIQMATKPQSIDVFVHNLGVVIDKSTGNLVYFNYLTKVDTFVIDLRGYSPSTTGQSTPLQNTYTGQDVQSTLDFSYSVQCQQGYQGLLCDLQCSNSIGNYVVCTSIITGQQQVCNYTDSTKTQVSTCQVCLNGVTNATCNDLAALNNAESNKVSKAFRAWTIALGVLLGLAILFIILLLILFIVMRRQSERQTSYQRQPNYSAGYGNRAPNTVTNPLISKSDEWPRTNPPTAMTRTGPNVDMETTQSTEPPRNGLSHYSPRREAEV